MNKNSAKELNSLMKKGEETVIVVVLETEILDQRTWFGTTAELHLGHKLYLDFSSEVKVLHLLTHLQGRGRV